MDRLAVVDRPPPPPASEPSRPGRNWLVAILAAGAVLSGGLAALL